MVGQHISRVHALLLELNELSVPLDSAAGSGLCNKRVIVHGWLDLWNGGDHRALTDWKSVGADHHIPLEKILLCEFEGVLPSLVSNGKPRTTRQIII